MPEIVYELLKEESKLQGRKLSKSTISSAIIMDSLSREYSRQWWNAWVRAHHWNFSCIMKWIEDNKWWDNNNKFYLDMMCE